MLNMIKLKNQILYNTVVNIIKVSILIQTKNLLMGFVLRQTKELY